MNEMKPPRDPQAIERELELLRQEKHSIVLGVCGQKQYPYAYAISRYADRINFETQQIRAINLIDALFGTSKIREGDEIVVVGAGIAGVTASARLLERGCKVTMIEKNQEEGVYFAAQQKASHRFIHPNIGFWPEDPLGYTTNLPLLNWHADSCDRVINQISEEWNDIRGKYKSEFRAFFGTTFINVTDLSGPSGGKYSFFIQNEKTGDSTDCSRKDRKFNLLILCTGFEVEDTLHGIPSANYWQLRNPTDAPLVVCGSGDGGLIDAILDVFDTKMENLVGIAKLIEKEYGRDHLKGFLIQDPLIFVQTNMSFLDRALPKLKKKAKIVTKNRSYLTQETAFLHRILACFAKESGSLDIHENSVISPSKKKGDPFEIKKPGSRSIPLTKEEVILVRIGPMRRTSSLLDYDLPRVDVASEKNEDRVGLLEKKANLSEIIQQSKEKDREWTAYARTRIWDYQAPIDRDRDKIYRKAIKAIYRWIDHQNLQPPFHLALDYCDTYFQIFSNPPIHIDDIPSELFGIELRNVDELPKISVAYG